MDPKIAKGEMTLREAYNKTYDINVSGTQVLTHTILPLLLKSTDPRLIFITSGLSSLENMSNPSGPKPRVQSPDGYRASKVALNLVMLSWHARLREDGVKVWCVSPGFLATGLGGDRELLIKSGAGDPSIGGKLITSVVEGERDADVGKVVAGQGVQPF